MYRQCQNYSYSDLLQRQAMSDSNRIGLTPDKENSYAVLQKKKQLQNREGSYSSQQKNEQKAMQKSSSLQHFYRAQSAIEKSSYSNQKKTYVKDIKNPQHIQAGYKQRHNQVKQIQDEKLEIGIVLAKPNQQYKRLNDKLHNLEKQIIHLKESFENNESQLEKKTERTKQYSLASKFFKKKKAESNSKNNSQDEKRVPKDIKQIYNIYSQIREFKNYTNNTQLLKKVQEKKKFQLQDFVTQIKGKYQKSDKKYSFASQISNLNKSERPQHLVEVKQSYCLKMSETQQNDNFLYYISTVIESLNKTDPSRIDEIVIDHFSQTLQGLVYATGLDLTFDESKIVNLPRSNNLKTIVFDLDETLVHCNESISIPGDAILPITFPNGETVQASVNIRPYAQKVLQSLSKHFELIIFTASHSSYANIVIDYLDPRKQWISHRLYREQCLQTPEGAYVKDLRVLGNRKLCNVLLVDNAGYSFGQQIDNGVPIVAYYDNKDDQELLNLQNYLMNFRYVKDVQEFNKKSLKLNQFINFQDGKELLENLFPELYYKGVN